MILRISCLIGALVAWTAGGAPPRAKLLHTGWDFTNNNELREHYQEMEAQMPFDGVIFPLLNADGYASSLNIWNAEDWSGDIFAAAVADLKSCKFQRFTDNFALAWVSPGPVDWFDDATWDKIARKFAILARAAKDAGLKGICFDPEPYMQFKWGYDPASGRSWEDTMAIARRRGAEIMTAIGREYPGMTFLTFWMFSLPQNRMAAETRRGDRHWGLYASFLEGIWDAAPPEMTLVDGMESGYNVATQTGALRSSLRVHHEYDELLPESSRARYRKQIRSGFGIYLAPYVNPVPGWIRHDGKQLTTLFHNLNYLLSAADEYVWFYSEGGRFFVAPEAENAWEHKLPGVNKALALARDPGAFLPELRERAAAGEIVNRWPNPDFRTEDVDGLNAPHRVDWRLVSGLPGYEAWFEGEPIPIAKDGESTRLRISGSATLIAPVPVTAGSVSFLELWYRGGKEGTVSVQGNVGFLNSIGDWIEMDNPMTAGKADEDGWIPLRLLIGPAPDGATQMVICLLPVGCDADHELYLERPVVYCLDDLLTPKDGKK